MSDTIAHSSHVTYAGNDSADDAVAWLTTTLYFRVPRLLNHTTFVADVDDSRSTHPPFSHRCHWYVTPDGASATAVSVTELSLFSPDSGLGSLTVMATVMGRHSMAIGADSVVTAEPYIALTLNVRTPAELDDTLFAADADDAPRSVHWPDDDHSCHWYDGDVPSKADADAVIVTD